MVSDTTLGPVAVDQLHQTFREAFADYALDASSTSQESLERRADRSGVDFELSVGAFAGERMVGFLLIGVGPWKGDLAAFDAGTGIVPEFRGGGLAGRMFEHALSPLREKGVTKFLLEVLQQNEPAIRAYEKAGFTRTRSLICLSREPGDTPVLRPADSIAIRKTDRSSVRALDEHVDWLPSWENNVAAIERATEELTILGAFSGDRCVGTLVYSQMFRWILHLVVDREFRRRGIASTLVEELLSSVQAEGKPIRITNVDASDDAMLACLRSCGFRPWVDQYEMELPLGND